MTKEMISIFPLWTFHLYVAAFQQHLHMEYIYIYIYLSWYDIPELVNPIVAFLLDKYLLSNLASIQHNLFINSLIVYNIFLYVLYACSKWSLYYVNLLY